MIKRANRKLKANLRKLRIVLARLIWDKPRKEINEKNKNIEIDLVKNDNINSILFLRADGKIGDMVVSTFMFREIKKKYPNMKIGVVTKGAAKDIIKNNPYIDTIYDYGTNFHEVRRLAEKISKEKYDLLMEFYEEIKPMEIMFINRCKARLNIGLDKKNWKLFDISIDENKDFKSDEHVSKRYMNYLEKLGINFKKIDDLYEIFFDEKKQKKLEKLKNQYKNDKIVILNPFGASKHRNFSEEIIKKILNLLKETKVIILYYGDKSEFVKKIGIKYDNVIIPVEIKNILDSAMYISIADLVISPDTSIIHIAECFNKKIIGVYEYDGGILGAGHRVWGPREKSNHKLVFTPKRKSTYDDFDVNDFDMGEMSGAIKKFL